MAINSSLIAFEPFWFYVILKSNSRKFRSLTPVVDSQYTIYIQPKNSLENLNFKFQFLRWKKRIGFPEWTLWNRSLTFSNCFVSLSASTTVSSFHLSAVEQESMLHGLIERRERRKHWNISKSVQLFAPFFHSLHAHLSTSLYDPAGGSLRGSV